MRITITRNGERFALRCRRADGSSTASDVGPGLPHHDLAHFVVETELGLKQGFFGNIALGRSISELGEKEVILSLPKESLKAEVLARAMGSLATGACRVDQFEELVNLELRQWNVPEIEVDVARVEAMQGRFAGLLDRLSKTRDGEAMELEFEGLDG